MTESVLLSLVVQCSDHAPQAEFILFAIRCLYRIGCVRWDSFLLSLLSTVSSTETTLGNVHPSSIGLSSANVSSFHVSNPASPLSSIHGIGSPPLSVTEHSTVTNPSPVKASDLPDQSFASRTGFLRRLCCKIILSGLEWDLKPATHAEIFSHMMNWLSSWDQSHQSVEGSDVLKHCFFVRMPDEWLHICLDVIWKLVEEDRCRVPFYELLRRGLQLMDNISDDQALFSFMLEIHKRRDMVATHMRMLDQHLHCLTFGNHRLMSYAQPNITAEPLTNLRYAPVTYPSVLGEPLQGEVRTRTGCYLFHFISLVLLNCASYNFIIIHEHKNTLPGSFCARADHFEFDFLSLISCAGWTVFLS